LQNPQKSLSGLAKSAKPANSLRTLSPIQYLPLSIKVMVLLSISVPLFRQVCLLCQKKKPIKE
ncbi:MAG: hypothetical protein ACRC2O_10530, partial [Chitinophagaceae bacterium]